jgi:hypothetical protein
VLWDILSTSYISRSKIVFREPNSITYYYVVGALVAACAQLLIRLYAEGIRGYCAIKQLTKTTDSVSETQQWYQKETNNSRVVSV